MTVKGGYLERYLTDIKDTVTAYENNDKVDADDDTRTADAAISADADPHDIVPILAS